MVWEVLRQQDFSQTVESWLWQTKWHEVVGETGAMEGMKIPYTVI